MKKFLLLIFIISIKLNAQPYSFSQSTAPYSDLAGATTLTTSAPWSYATAFTVPIGFTFNFMGVNYTTVYVEGSGFTYFDLGYNYLALPFTVKMQSKGSSGNNSPISYKVDGVAPNRICKVQWKNAGFYYDTTSTINLQMWLYETNNIVEVHIGASSVANPSVVYQENGSDGPVIGVYEYNGASCTYSNCLSGNPAAPTVNNPTGTFNIFGTSLNATPASGTVYIFDPSANSIEEHSQTNTLVANVVHDYITFSTTQTIQSCVLYSLDGRTSVSRIPEGNQLFVGDLPVGMYLIEVNCDGVISRQKLVISG
jgi:hypothetical protein